MFKRSFLAGALAIALVAGLAQSGQAATWFKSLTSDTLNTWEDQSREAVFDLNGNGVFDIDPGADGTLGTADDIGDVIIGFLSLDNKKVPDSIVYTGDQLNAVFSQQLAFSSATQIDTDGDLVNDSTSYFQVFKATTTAGLTLGDIAPQTAGLAANQVAAMYEDCGFDPLLTSPGDVSGNGVLDILDFLYAIDAGGTLDLTAGFVAGDADNFVESRSINPFIYDPIANLSLLDSAPVGSPVGAVFQLGLSVLYNPAAPIVTYNDVVDIDLPSVGRTNQLGISNGNTSGVSDDAYGAVTNPWTNSVTDTNGVVYLAGDVYGLADNANVSVEPHIIPEPHSIVIWGLLVALIGWRVHRRRK